MDSFPIELEVNVREITVEFALNTPVKASPAIPNIDHSNFEALLKYQFDQLFNRFITNGSNILSLVGVSSKYLVRKFPRMKAFNKESQS